MSCIGTEAAGSAPRTFEFRPGVIVDPVKKVIYLMNPEMGIDALKIDSGKTLWSTKQAAKPLLLADGVLVAQAEDPARPRILRIVTLDADKGNQVREASVELPEGVDTALKAGLGTSFTSDVVVLKGEAIISWSFTRRYTGGMRPTPDQEAPQESKGRIRFHLRTGRLTQVAEDQGSITSPVELELPPRLAELVEKKVLPHSPWRAGDVYAWAEPQGRGNDRKVVLKRWSADTGASLPDVILFGNELTMRYPSADHRYLLASKATGATKERGIEYEWNIYSLETGERTATINDTRPGAWFFLSGRTLIHEAQAYYWEVKSGWDRKPRRLVAIQLGTGQEIWSHPLRDTAYRGTLPPTVDQQGSGDPPPGQRDANSPSNQERREN